MNLWQKCWFFIVFTALGCGTKRQIYADRMVDFRNRHVYVNDKLDFSITYFDVINKKNRQTDSIRFKKSTVPPELQKHLLRSVHKPSEILFWAHRSSMSQEDIIAVLYKNPAELLDFTKKTKKQLRKIVPLDSIDTHLFQTSTGYLLNTQAFKENNYLGSDFIQKRPFNALRYFLHNKQSDYKVHEFHVPYDDKLTLRLIWVADLRKTVAMQGWEKIDDQNHYLELFSLNDSARFRLQEVVPENPFKLAADAFKETGYPGAVNAIAGFEPTVEKKGTAAQKSMYNQAMMTYYSFLGDHKQSLAYMDKAFGAKPPMVSDSVFMDYKTVDAAQYILQNIGNQRIVMFNEAHNCGQHRAFLRDILRGFYDKGFRYLSLEDLTMADSINERGYPLRGQNGFYSLEPTFSQALREAKNLGFTLVEHDDESEQREERQAENIYNVLKSDPSVKVLVWAGHAHVHEQPVGNDKPRMAYFLTKLSGINPWTIETTAMREHSKEEYESGYYRAALKKAQATQPFVMLKEDAVFVEPRLKNAVDMQIFFPRTDYAQDYPLWMGNSTAYSYTLDIDKEHFKDKLLEIFLLKEYAKEIESAMPVMNIPLSRIGQFKLFLKPDHYVAVIRDAGNWEYLYKEFEVK
ncbi:MAG: hypothetical protein JNL70_08115 [Saprospiraceae bacterium]|nr:hypothetical protein [Saprospiraceae bacterium]